MIEIISGIFLYILMFGFCLGMFKKNTYWNIEACFWAVFFGLLYFLYGFLIK